MNREEAIKILGLDQQKSFDLSTLKSAYRQKCFQCHPDHGGSAEAFRRLAAAYDMIAETCMIGQGWGKTQVENIPKWRKDFRQLWRKAYEKSLSQKIDDGLHFHTCIENFRRGYIYPPQDWFLDAIFGGSSKLKGDGYALLEKAIVNGEDAKTYYRNHLLRIAPNQRMAESYAKRYFELEFEAKWVFYLPSSVDQLRSVAT